jgi:predicted transcriptional regulator
MANSGKMLKKTFWITPKQLTILETIAKQKGSSMSAVARAAINAYDPHRSENEEDEVLKELVSMLIRSATVDLRKVRERFERVLDELSAKRP